MRGDDPMQCPGAETLFWDMGLVRPELVRSWFSNDLASAMATNMEVLAQQVMETQQVAEEMHRGNIV